MRVGLTSDRFRHLPVPVVLGLMRWAGVSFSEMSPASLSQGRWCRRAAGSMGLGLHLPDKGSSGYDFSSACAVSAIETLLGRLEKSASFMNLEYALFHGPETEEPERLPWHRFTGYLRRVPAPLILENALGQDAEAFADLAARVKRDLKDRLAGICLDIPHAFLGGEDWRRMLDRFPVRVIHLSDCQAHRDAHLPFGAGVLPVNDILEELKARQFRGVLNLEILPPSFSGVQDLLQSYLTARRVLDPQDFSFLEKRIQRISRLFPDAGTRAAKRSDPGL